VDKFRKERILHIIKVTSKFHLSDSEYLVVHSEEPFQEAEILHKKHYPDAQIEKMEVISTQVINAWAQ